MNVSIRNPFVSRLCLAVALALPCVAAGAHPLAPPASRAHPDRDSFDSSQFMPESAIRYGQTGYALTVFHGTKIERFGVKMLGVLKQVNNGRDLILFRATGGPSVTRDAMIVAGMSGSPVYVHGRMVGAIAYGLPFAREPIGLITPIRDMLDSWDPDLPKNPQLSAAQETRGLTESGVSVSGSQIAPLLSGQGFGAGFSSGPMSFEPMMTPIAVSGMSPEGIARLSEQLAPYRLMPVAGGGTGAENLSHAQAIKAAAGLQPGAAVGVSLAQGDLDLTAIGTLTYRDGNRIVAFGHPFTGIGPIDAALTTASITDIFPSYQESTKLGMPLDTVGRIFQDRPFSVGGTIGARPTMIPVSVSIDDESDKRQTQFHARVLNHPLLTGVLTLTVVNEAILEAHGTPGDAVAYVTTDVDADQVGHIVRHNVFYDPVSINTSALGDLNSIVNLLSANPFYQVAVKSVDVKVRIENLHATADIDHIVVPRLTYAPGDTVDVGVVLRPYKQDPVVRTVALKIPENTPDGSVGLVVRGGAMSDTPTISLDANGGVSVHSSSEDAGEPPPSTVQQLVNQFLREPRNNDLVADLILPSAAPEVGGEKLSLLPPTMSALMRSEHVSALHVSRDEIKSSTAMPWVVTGAQQLTINVRAKDNYDVSTADNGEPPPPSRPAPPDASVGAPASGSGASDGGQVGAIDGDSDQDPDSNSDSDSDSSSDTDSVSGMPADFPAGAKAVPNGPPAPPSADSASTASPVSVSVSTSPIDNSVADGSASDIPVPPILTSVARVASIWRENTASQFANGTLDGVTVTNAPDIRVAPAIAKIAATSESYVWSQAYDTAGNLYIGTGDDGLIYKIAAGANLPTLFARTSQLEVTALAYNPDTGDLYAATAPHGIVYRIPASGKVATMAALTDPYIPAMLLDRDHKTLYLATAGGTGRVYAVDADAATTTSEAPRVIFTSPDVHLLCLAQGPDGSLYTGGNPNGVVYKLDPASVSNKAHVVYDSPGPTVSAVAVDSKNRLYVGTAPSGAIVQIDLDDIDRYTAPQIAKPMVAHTDQFVSGLTVDNAGNVWGSAGDTLYRITPGYDSSQPASRTAGYNAESEFAADTVATFPSDPQVTYTSIIGTPEGGVTAGTASIGAVYGFRGSPVGNSVGGAYTSAIHDSRLKSRWGTIDWSADLPGGSSLSIETRTGDVPKPDSTWSDWSPAYDNPAGSPITSPPARFMQYRAIESEPSNADSSSSPKLSSVDIYYMTEDRPPSVRILAPTGGDDVCGDVALRWIGTDPDRDTLEYRLYSSSDDGATWTQIDTGALRQRSVPEASPATAPSTAGAGPSAQSLETALAGHPEIPAAVRRTIIQDASTSASTGASTGPGDVVAAGAATDDGPAPTLRGQTFTWNTKLTSNGVYRLKVVASDAPSNPVGALTAYTVSDPFTVVNTPPVIAVDPGPAIDAKTGAITISGAVTSTLVFVKAVQYKIDDGGWMAAAAADGLYDSTNEGFRIVAQPITRGSHRITIEAFDSAGNTSTQTVDTK
jgi:hypothetical protein